MNISDRYTGKCLFEAAVKTLKELIGKAVELGANLKEKKL